MALEDLYREVIIDHSRNPRNRAAVGRVDAHAEGHNPLCGDEIDIDLEIEEGVVTGIAVSGQGCSISQASASMMSEAIKGKTLAEIETIADRFKMMIAITESDEEILDPNRPGAVLGDLEALQGVRKFPVRVKCAGLGWATLLEALELAPNSR